MKTFVMVVDGEAVSNFQFPEKGDAVSDETAEEFTRLIAIYSSDPRIIPYGDLVKPGSMWNGSKFIEPKE